MELARWEMGLKELEIGGQIETNEIIAISRSARILRVLDTWWD